ncbi:LAME_0G10528g1_1 [Lachancea meyersii CBS 8951]|uniref:LAME_0G10528g1_1 n=1 Tax=Lachancea meyersii CBS 8951 TaxID=1266667 RepID=A0A1G4K903_9SACH|nr:LAME_0G10528g1_1 [Lachancea meyersii CBS 8951]
MAKRAGTSNKDEMNQEVICIGTGRDGADEEEEEDYMTMDLSGEDVTTEQPQHKSKLRRIDSEQEQASKILPRGFAMMTKMGFNIGEGLGQNDTNALKAPIRASGYGGPIRVRNFQLSVPGEGQASDFDEKTYQKWIQHRGQRSSELRTLRVMQKTAFELNGDVECFSTNTDSRDVNCLWRRYVMDLQQKMRPKETNTEEQEGRQRSRAPAVATGREKCLLSSEKENQEKCPLENASTIDSDDLESDADKELQLFEDQTLSQQISRVHTHMRTEFFYCFYCGVQFSTEEELHQQCPGPTPEDHC